MTVRIIPSFVAMLMLASPLALAGDCFEHPLQVYEVEVASCKPLSRNNITRVSAFLAHGGKEAQAVLPKLVEQNRDLVVVTGTLRRSTAIHQDERPLPPLSPERAPSKAEPWKNSGAPIALLYRPGSEKAGGACATMPSGAVVTLARETDCSCDTGPLNGEWCWLDGHRPVHDLDEAARSILAP